MAVKSALSIRKHRKALLVLQYIKSCSSVIPLARASWLIQLFSCKLTAGSGGAFLEIQGTLSVLSCDHGIAAGVVGPEDYSIHETRSTLQCGNLAAVGKSSQGNSSSKWCLSMSGMLVFFILFGSVVIAWSVLSLVGVMIFEVGS